jgi:hypothetical protein
MNSFEKGYFHVYGKKILLAVTMAAAYLVPPLLPSKVRQNQIQRRCD